MVMSWSWREIGRDNSSFVDEDDSLDKLGEK